MHPSPAAAAAGAMSSSSSSRPPAASASTSVHAQLPSQITDVHTRIRDEYSNSSANSSGSEVDVEGRTRPTSTQGHSSVAATTGATTSATGESSSNGVATSSATSSLSTRVNLSERSASSNITPASRMPDRPRSPLALRPASTRVQSLPTPSQSPPPAVLAAREAAAAQQQVHEPQLRPRATSPRQRKSVRAERGSAVLGASVRRGAPRHHARRASSAHASTAGTALSAGMAEEAVGEDVEEADRHRMRSRERRAGIADMAARLTRQVAQINRDLQASAESVESAEAVLLALARFALSPKNPSLTVERRDALIEAGSVDLMVRLQKTHVEDVQVQAMAAWAIESMCHDDASMQLAFGKAGAVEAIVASVGKHDASLDVIEHALRALSALTWEPSNRDVIGKCGGLEVVISTMGRHADMGAVQADGATLLANSAFGHEQNKVLLANSFGLDAIVTAMRGFINDSTLQNHCCLALRNLTWGLQRNKETAGVKGAVNAVIDALQVHISDAAVVEQASAALCIMLEEVPSNIERLLNSSDWMSVLLKTLRHYSDAESVQINLLTVLAAVVLQHRDKVPALIRAGAIEVALNGMRRNVTRRGVMHAGAHCARALLTDASSEAEAALRGAGGISTLLDMLYCSVTAPPPAPSPSQKPISASNAHSVSATAIAGITSSVTSPVASPSAAAPGSSSSHQQQRQLQNTVQLDVATVANTPPPPAPAAPQRRSVPWV